MKVIMGQYLPNETVEWTIRSGQYTYQMKQVVKYLFVLFVLTYSYWNNLTILKCSYLANPI